MKFTATRLPPGRAMRRCKCASGLWGRLFCSLPGTPLVSRLPAILPIQPTSYMRYPDDMDKLKHVLAIALLLCARTAVAQISAAACGSLETSFGPYDYRADKYVSVFQDQESHSHKRMLVEGAHFTPRVEMLIGAQSGGQIGPPGADLDYTLRVFPNNHRALNSVIRYGEKTKQSQPPGLPREVECYLERALRFRPDDVIVRMLYATYLLKNNRQAEAIAQLERSTALAGDNPFTHNNIGLVYFDMKIYDKALARAHRAMELGFERTDLHDLLTSVGQWQEPSTTATPKK